MNRIEIKAQARKLIERKLWIIWKPILLYVLIQITIVSLLLIIGIDIDDNNFANILVNIVLMPITIGLNLYILKFIRGKSFSIKDIFSTYKNFTPIVLAMALVGLFTFFGFVALIIPGIIIALMFSMVQYLLADGKTNVGETLNKSQKLMSGYKIDYLIFNLSFIGWFFLIIVTFGLAIIYVEPYITVANAIYYDKLKELKKV